MKLSARVFLAILAYFILSSASVSSSAAVTAKTQAHVVAEIPLVSTGEHKDPFNDLEVNAIFTGPGGKAISVPAFWAGGKNWRVRFSSPTIGSHRFVTQCSDPKDTGLQGIEGVVEVEAYAGDNPLFQHGPIRIAPSRRYFEHADGTPFFWLGDTWWMGLCDRLDWPNGFQKLAQDRVKKGFNVVQIVAGLYPDMPAFDERGANEAGFPWEKDYARIRPEYFDAADQRIRYLVEQGITPCIVGAWGFHMPWLGEARMKQHLRYCYARWGALPTIWCVAGELNLPFYKAPGFPFHAVQQTAQWEEVISAFRSMNVFKRLVSAHPTGIAPMSIRGILKDDSVLDFDMLQTPHGQFEVLPKTIATVRYSYNARPLLPTVNAEPTYEMLFDKTPAEVARAAFWSCVVSGARGYTYGANGIWQVNRKGKPYGNSPTGGTYGVIAWDDAMNLAGSSQVGYAKKFLADFPWQKMEPLAGVVAWADPPAGPSQQLPLCMGITGDVYMAYVPSALPIRISPLEKDRSWTVSVFDPVAGEHQQSENAEPGPDGTLTMKPPAFGHDWVAVIQASKEKPINRGN